MPRPSQASSERPRQSADDGPRPAPLEQATSALRDRQIGAEHRRLGSKPLGTAKPLLADNAVDPVDRPARWSKGEEWLPEDYPMTPMQIADATCNLIALGLQKRAN